VTAGVATTLLHQPETAHACTPVPFISPKVYEQLLETYRPVETITKDWIAALQDQDTAYLGLRAVGFFIDDWCPTYPKRPPFPPGPPPPFERYADLLTGFDEVAFATIDWVEQADSAITPGISALTLLRDQFNAQFWPMPEPARELQLLWRPWWPWPC
jgi:hypothetical protein